MSACAATLVIKPPKASLKSEKTNRRSKRSSPSTGKTHPAATRAGRCSFFSLGVNRVAPSTAYAQQIVTRMANLIDHRERFFDHRCGMKKVEPAVRHSPVELMKIAIRQAQKCQHVSTAFSVGAVLASASGCIITLGYSRELPGNTHAEECCLLKLSSLDSARGATMYSTMEPCGERLSGSTPCATRLKECGIARVRPCIVLLTLQGCNWGERAEYIHKQDQGPRVSGRGRDSGRIHARDDGRVPGAESSPGTTIILLERIFYIAE